MTSHGYLFLRPEGQDSLPCLYFDNYDYIQADLDDRGKIILQGVYHSHAKNEQEVLLFNQHNSLFVNVPLIDNLKEISQEKEEDMSLSEESHFQKDL